MLREITTKSVMDFVNEFSLKIEKQTRFKTYFFDPYDVKYILTSGSIETKLPRFSEGQVLPYSGKITMHILKSLEEFVKFWRADKVETEFKYSTLRGESKGEGKIIVTMR